MTKSPRSWPARTLFRALAAAGPGDEEIAERVDKLLEQIGDSQGYAEDAEESAQRAEAAADRLDDFGVTINAVGDGTVTISAEVTSNG